MSLLDRVVAKKRRTDSDQPWRYWRTRPIQERLAAVELLRREHHGWVDGAEPRLSRVVEVVRRARR